MKKFILIQVLLIFLFTQVFSQSRIGFTEEQIKSEFYYNTFNSGYTNTGIYYISTTMDRAVVGYYFNDYGICTMVMLIPTSQGALNYYVQLYNDKYVIISSTEWKAYLENGGIITIQLILDGETPYFIYY